MVCGIHVWVAQVWSQQTRFTSSLFSALRTTWGAPFCSCILQWSFEYFYWFGECDCQQKMKQKAFIVASCELILKRLVLSWSIKTYGIGTVHIFLKLANLLTPVRYDVKLPLLKTKGIDLPAGVSDSRTLILAIQTAFPEHSWEPWRYFLLFFYQYLIDIQVG